MKMISYIDLDKKQDRMVMGMDAGGREEDGQIWNELDSNEGKNAG